MTPASLTALTICMSKAQTFLGVVDCLASELMPKCMKTSNPKIDSREIIRQELMLRKNKDWSVRYLNKQVEPRTYLHNASV